MTFGFGFGFPRSNLSGGFSPASLFAAGEPGGWYDPSDLTTMFQNRAGFTPVTAPGQSVGYRLDKSGRGNHLTAINDASRGTYGIEPLGGRRNLLTFTEQFDNAAWAKGNLTVNQVSGSQWRLTEAVTTSRKFLVFQGLGLVGGRLSIEAKPNGRNFISIGATNGSGMWSVWLFNVATGQSVGGFQAAGVPVPSNPTITATDNGFYRCSVTVTIDDAPVVQIGNGGNPIFEGYQGDGTSGLIVRQPQLEAGSTATAYQRVGTAFDVTQAGVPSLSYVSYDGVDDSYVSPTITPGTDKVQVFAGVRKLSDPTEDVMVALGSLPSHNGFEMQASGFFSNPKGFSLQNLGPGYSSGYVNNVTAPITKIFYGTINRGGASFTDRFAMRLDGVDQSLIAAIPQNVPDGNYLAYPLYIGRRGGTSLPFNGRDYGIIVRFGANLSTATIVQTESFLNQKTGAY